VADIPKAIDFAFSLETDMAHLCAIHPTRKNAITGKSDIIGRSFPKTDEGRAAALRWLTKADAGGYGLYFNCNEVTPRSMPYNAKASEAEVTVVHYLHVDVDLPKDTTPGNAEAARAAMRAKIKTASPMPPSLIINTGNGLGVFFAIDPVVVTDENREVLKAYNIALKGLLGGDSCQDLCHVMRLPYTINIPNAVKIAAGRVAVLADIADDMRPFFAEPYKLDQFTFDQADVSNDDAGDDDEAIDIPATVDISKLDDVLRSFIEKGPPADYRKSRSEAVYWVSCELRRQGWSDGAIIYVITNPDYSISAHILDQTQRPSDEQAMRVINDMNAKGVVRDPTVEEDFADADDDTAATDDLVREERRKLPKTLSLTELMEGNFPRTVYTVGDLVMQGVVNMLYANGGMGKTTIAIQMGVAVAAGRQIFGRDTIRGPALLVLAEDGRGEIKVRVGAALKDLGITDMSEMDCETWPVVGEEISIARIDETGKTVLQPFYYDLEKKLAAARARSPEGPGLFVVLDSLADIAEMGEAQRLPVNIFFKRVLGGLAVKYNATILVLGHPSKASMADGSYYSGSTAYRNAVRNMLVIKSIKDSTFRSLERLKNNYANPDDQTVLAWVEGVFVTTESTAVVKAEMSRYRAVLNTIRDLIGKGLDVARTNQADGQTPDEVAKAVNLLGVVKVTGKDVSAFMMQAERALDLKYFEGTNRRKAHYEMGANGFDVGDGPEVAAVEPDDPTL